MTGKLSDAVKRLPREAVGLYDHAVANPLPAEGDYDPYEDWLWSVSNVRNRRKKKEAAPSADPERGREVISETMDFVAQGTCPFCETPFAFVRVPGKAGAEIARCLLPDCERQFSSDRIVLVTPSVSELLCMLAEAEVDPPYWLAHANEWTDAIVEGYTADDAWSD
jgi:hypothetical protein